MIFTVRRSAGCSPRKGSGALSQSAAGVLAAAVFAAAPAIADPSASRSNDRETDNVSLTDYVVTAGRQAQSPDDVLAPVLVIGRDEIERAGATDITELLRFHAGLDIGRNGGPGQSTSVFIRGAESNHTLVLIDGVRINPGTIGGAALQNIAPEMVERIEVVKGPRSTLYGTEAIGGVVNVITRGRGGETRLETSLGAGRYDTRSATVAASFGNGPGWVSLGAGHTASGGFPTLAGNDDDRAYRNTTVDLGAGYDIGDTTVTVRHWQAEGEAEYLGFSVDPATAPPQAQDYTNASTELALATGVTDNWTTRLSVNRAEDDIRQLDSADRARTRRTGVDWQNDVSLGASHTLIAGVQTYREDTDASVFGLGFDEETTVTSVYASDNLSLDRHHLLVAARYTDHDAFDSQVTWNVEYGYDIATATRVTLAAGTGFRAPDSTDRFGFGGNPDLDPETSQNLELSVRTTLGGGHRLRAGVFENTIDDLITYDFDPVTFDGLNRNIDRARIRGAEFGYRYARGSWQLRADLIVQDPEDRTTGRQLPRRSERSATAGVVRSFGEHELALDLLATDRRPDSSFSFVENAGYVLTNLSFRARLGDRMSLTGRVENLFDANYQTAAGFNAAGRGLYVTLRYNR